MERVVDDVSVWAENIRKTALVKHATQVGYWMDDFSDLEEVERRIEAADDAQTMSHRQRWIDEGATSVDNPESLAVKSQLFCKVKEAMESLTPREARVLQLRFGLDGCREHTLEEASSQLGVSRERVRQIEMKALRQLHRTARRALAPFRPSRWDND